MLNLEIFFFGNLFHCFYFFRKSNLPTNVFQIQYFRTSVAYSMTFYFQLWYLTCALCYLEITFFFIFVFSQGMKLSQLRPLPLQSLSQRGT